MAVPMLVLTSGDALSTTTSLGICALAAGDEAWAAASLLAHASVAAFAAAPCLAARRSCAIPPPRGVAPVRQAAASADHRHHLHRCLQGRAPPPGLSGSSADGPCLSTGGSAWPAPRFHIIHGSHRRRRHGSPLRRYIGELSLIGPPGTSPTVEAGTVRISTLDFWGNRAARRQPRFAFSDACARAVSASRPHRAGSARRWVVR